MKAKILIVSIIVCIMLISVSAIIWLPHKYSVDDSNIAIVFPSKDENLYPYSYSSECEKYYIKGWRRVGFDKIELFVVRKFDQKYSPENEFILVVDSELCYIHVEKYHGN